MKFHAVRRILQKIFNAYSHTVILVNIDNSLYNLIDFKWIGEKTYIGTELNYVISVIIGLSNIFALRNIFLSRSIWN
jgi:hypothetical protein